MPTNEVQYDNGPTHKRTILGAHVEIFRGGSNHVTVSVRAGIFKRRWDVELSDARWVRDTLFEVLS